MKLVEQKLSILIHSLFKTIDGLFSFVFPLFSFLLYLFSCIFSLSSCIKQPLPPKEAMLPKQELSDRIMYVLNEGLFNSNNATLTHFNISQLKAGNGYFEIKNNRKLGDTGNDIAKYGSKTYIVVTGSNLVDVLNKSGESIAQISFLNGSVNRKPRSIAFYQANAYVCSFDGTIAVIDTNTLTITQFINVGRNPEDIVVQNGKLYVSNSGGLDAPNYDSTVSVINLASNLEVKQINIGINPGDICADDFGDVYVVARGDYTSIKSKLYVINTTTDAVKKVYNMEALGIVISKNIGYVHFYDFTKGTSSIARIEVEKDSILDSDFIDGSLFQTLYAVAVDPITDDIYCTDAKGFVNTGKVLCFDKNGNKLFEFQTGLNPGSLAFIE